jgi:hypothetical protein
MIGSIMGNHRALVFSGCRFRPRMDSNSVSSQRIWERGFVAS